MKNKIGTTGCREKPENATEWSTRSRAVEEKLTGVVGLYMNPPDKALVLCVDEKNQIPALERMASLLRLIPHILERQTVDYGWHGTMTLFAELDMRPGMVSGKVRIIILQKNTLLFKGWIRVVRKGKSSTS